MPQLNSRELLERARRAQAPGAPASATEPEQSGLSAQALLVAGRAEYQQGNLDLAAEFLQLAARANPDSTETHHLLGNVQQDQGRLDRAIASYRRALKLDPRLSAAENDLGTAYYAQGQHQHAVEAFERCVALDPWNYRAFENLGSVRRALGQFGPARNAFKRAFWTRLKKPFRRLLAAPAKPPFRSGREADEAALREAKEAYEAYRGGRYADAERLCALSLEHSPGNQAAMHVQALALNQRQQYAPALAILEALVRKSPESAEYLDAMGTSLRGLRQFDRSLACFNRALELNPQSAVIHSNVSALMIDRGDYMPAETAARAALTIEPNLGAAMVNLGAALMAQDRAREAEAVLRRALELNPRSPKARLRLSESLRDQDRLEEMRLELEELRRIDPDNPDLHLNLGILAQDVERDMPAALAHFRKAQSLAPQHAGTFLNEALLRLMNGEFTSEAWELYESRKRIPDRVDGYTKVALPEWNGARVAPGELLVYGEQGLGDEIMFASMLPQALALAPRLRFAAQPRLCGLFARSFPEAQVVPWDRDLGGPDLGAAKFAVAIGSLCRFFRHSPQDFPRHAGYLRPDSALLEVARARLAALGPGLRIGLSWRGGVPLTWRSRRSLQLADLTRVLQRPGCRWINLQYGDVGPEIEHFAAESGIRIERLHDATHDFEEAAALVGALDLVLSVCNTTVHLGGALGRPVWVMAPYTPDWRYGIANSRMPWYPEVELLRQRRHGDWASVLEEVRARLEALLAQSAEG